MDLHELATMNILQNGTHQDTDCEGSARNVRGMSTKELRETMDHSDVMERSLDTKRHSKRQELSSCTTQDR